MTVLALDIGGSKFEIARVGASPGGCSPGIRRTGAG